MGIEELLTPHNEVFRTYLICAAVLAIKILMMGPLTAKQRISKKVFANPEDAKAHNVKPVFDDPDVERVRRALLNDLENIPVFWILGFLFVFINPPVTATVWVFRAFTSARIFHTVAYVWAIPQPARGLAYLVGLVLNMYLAINIIISVW